MKCFNIQFKRFCLLLFLNKTGKDFCQTFSYVLGLAQKFLKCIPSGYKRVDIVADTYQEFSIKNAERGNRGESSKILVKSLQSKIPRDFQAFLLNGDNKTRMMELIAEYIETRKAKVFNILHTNKILISLDNKCISISRLSTTVEESLKSNQEEADTKVILHCLQILKSNQTSIVKLRSPSGDTDIVVLSVALLYEFRNRVILDEGSGDNRKIM